MENFSTPHAALVPRIANLATVAVVLAATWWSSAQRPVEQPAEAALAVPATSLQGHSQPAPAAAAPQAPQVNQASWPVQTTVLPHDILQAVGYLPATTRR
jgi:hypothetical protein